MVFWQKLGYSGDIVEAGQQREGGSVRSENDAIMHRHQTALRRCCRRRTAALLTSHDALEEENRRGSVLRQRHMIGRSGRKMTER